MQKSIKINIWWGVFFLLLAYLVGLITRLVPESLIFVFYLLIIVLAYYVFKHIENITNWRHSWLPTPPRFYGNLTKIDYKKATKIFVESLIDLGYFDISITDLPPGKARLVILASIAPTNKLPGKRKGIPRLLDTLRPKIVYDIAKSKFKVEFLRAYHKEYRKSIKKEFKEFLNIIKKRFGNNLKLERVLT
jgi:hypothetical protein